MSHRDYPPLKDEERATRVGWAEAILDRRLGGEAELHAQNIMQYEANLKQLEDELYITVQAISAVEEMGDYGALVQILNNCKVVGPLWKRDKEERDG